MALVAFAAIPFLNGCNQPVSNAAQLAAIRVEAKDLMATRPLEHLGKWGRVPKEQWPATIAGLHPKHVTVDEWGVDILIKPYFDGGYGYEVPRSKADLRMPASCYSELSQGVYWHDPC